MYQNITSEKEEKPKFTGIVKYWDMFTGILYPIIVGGLLLILWENQILHRIFRTNTFTLPLPSRIVKVITDNLPSIFENVQATLIVVLVGLLLGSVLGYLVALIATIFPTGGVGGITIVSAFNAIPIVALAPVFTNWTKDFSSDASIRSMLAKIIVVTVVCMAAMSVNAYRGLTELPAFSLDLLKIVGSSKLQIFTKLRLPNSIPFIFIALKIAVPASVISAMVSEYFAEYVIGIGRQIRENIVLSQYATAWAYIVVACFVGTILYILLVIAEIIFMRKR